MNRYTSSQCCCFDCTILANKKVHLKDCVKGTPLRSGRVTHINRNVSKPIFLFSMYLVYQNLFCVPNIPSIDLATRFKIGMYLLNREKRFNAFLRST